MREDMSICMKNKSTRLVGLVQEQPIQRPFRRGLSYGAHRGHSGKDAGLCGVKLVETAVRKQTTETMPHFAKQQDLLRHWLANYDTSDHKNRYGQMST